MSELLFGTAGVPRSAKASDTISGLERVKELGLGVMELEFVRGVKMGEAAAREVRKRKDALGIRLTAHAPYFINLNAREPAKLSASIERILASARIGQAAGAESVTFHPGFYLGEEAPKVYQTIKKHLAKIARQLRTEKTNIMLSPELTGKPSQFGSLIELIRLAKELAGVGLCIDFSHLHARSGGNHNTYKEFARVLEEVKQHLGSTALKQMHIHIAGIKYTAKGERKHLNLVDSDFDYRALLKVLKDYKVGGFLISESPNLEGDAVLMKKFYGGL